MTATHRRSDGFEEVADTFDANQRYGCTRDNWCILTNGHAGDCNEERELWPGPDMEYGS